MLPLTNVRVLDRTDDSGACCIRLLADLGAQIERDGVLGDDVDLVVVTGTPSALAERGDAPAALLKRHPRLIVAAMSPFGLDGPRAEWRACDTVLQALGGMVFVNGHPVEAPLRGMGPQAYHSAGVQAAIGIVLALLARGRTGRGQIVDVSVLESTVAALEHVSPLYYDSGAVAARQGTLHWSASFRVAECRDGLVLLSQLGDWTALLAWLQDDGAAADLGEPRWQDAAGRRAECRHVFDVLAQWARRYRVGELVEQAQLRRLPFAPLLSLREVVAHPQLWARGFFQRDAAGAPTIVGPLRRAFADDAPDDDEHGATATSARALPFAATPRGALAGIRVLDFTWVVAGPTATRILADHGADVIKVERLDSPADAAERQRGLFGALNRGKRSLAIDLNDPRGIDVVRALAHQCDVVIDNFSPRVMTNWGLDRAALRAQAPHLVVVSLSAFGATGPLADTVGYGPTLQAHAGFTWHMRHPGGTPAGWGFSYSDTLSGAGAALAVVAALFERGRTGRGRAIDLAQLEMLAGTIGSNLARTLSGERVPDALGNRAPEGDAAPSGIYRCRDAGDGAERWCAISVGDDAAWARFVTALGAPAAMQDMRYVSAAGRLEHAASLDRHVEAWTRTCSAETVVATLQAAGIAAGVVADARDLAGDPQLAARGYWVSLPHAATMDGIVARLSATPGAVTTRAPHLGEHGDEVLRDLLRMEQSAIDRLRRGGVIR